MKKKNVIVVGGGLVGSLLVGILAKHGYSVKLFERRPDVRLEELSAGKSINLAISTRGWKAVELISARQEIEKIAILMYGRMIHDLEGHTELQPYGKPGQAIYSISRGQLNATLLAKSDEFENVEMSFNERCVHVDLENNVVTLENVLTREKTQASADLIFGTDGAFSQVRHDMMHTRRFNYEQEFIPHGYRELLMPANEDGTHKLEKNALHIWPRGKFMLIALPNLDGSYTCTLFMPYEGEVSFESLKTNSDIEVFFEEYFADFKAQMPDLISDFEKKPLSDLVNIHCYPWVYKNTAILGDASHAIVPFYGQGMNAGFEDCTVLNELIEKHNHDWDKILPEFQVLRKPNADAIYTLAMENYIEMRDLVADPEFVLRKKIEAKIYKNHPDKWIPLYSQVTFTHIPYSEALKTGRLQEKIMREVMNRPDIEHVWDSEDVELEILSKLEYLQR